MHDREERGPVREVEEHVVVVYAPSDGDCTTPGEHMSRTDLARKLCLETRRGGTPRVEPLDLAELRRHWAWTILRAGITQASAACTPS
jgi:hypothetical protein